MKALCWNGKNLAIEGSYSTPQSDLATALVRVRLAGICSTDLQIFKGYMGFRGVPGHEFVGQVEEGPEELVGKRVVGEINFACAQCEFCARGLGRHCSNRRVMGILGADGSFAEYVVIPSANLHPVPEALPDEEAVFTEPLLSSMPLAPRR